MPGRDVRDPVPEPESMPLGGPVKRFSILSFFLLSLALTGCADVVFKAGASPGEIQRDEIACREQAEDDAAYDACMTERGYHLARTEGALGWAPASR